MQSAGTSAPRKTFVANAALTPSKTSMIPAAFAQMLLVALDTREPSHVLNDVEAECKKVGFVHFVRKASPIGDAVLMRRAMDDEDDPNCAYLDNGINGFGAVTEGMIERKTAGDMDSSIRGKKATKENDSQSIKNRYQDQKSRAIDSGIRNITWIVSMEGVHTFDMRNRLTSAVISLNANPEMHCMTVDMDHAYARVAAQWLYKVAMNFYNARNRAFREGRTDVEYSTTAFVPGGRQGSQAASLSSASLSSASLSSASPASYDRLISMADKEERPTLLPQKLRPLKNVNFSDARPRAARSAEDVYRKMLGLPHGVSNDFVDAIILKYPTMDSLLTAYRQGQTCDGEMIARSKLLAKIQLTETRTIGPVVSARVWEIVFKPMFLNLMNKDVFLPGEIDGTEEEPSYKRKRAKAAPKAAKRSPRPKKSKNDKDDSDHDKDDDDTEPRVLRPPPSSPVSASRMTTVKGIDAGFGFLV